MRFCAICSKKLNLFNTRKDIRLKSGEEICLFCSNKLDADTLSNIGNMEKYELVESILEKDKIKKYCCICHEKMTILNTSLLLKNTLNTNEKICTNCLRKLDTTTLLEIRKLTREEVVAKISELEEEKKKKANVTRIESDAPKKVFVVEYRRTCNHCGKVWHVLAEREKYLESEKRCNDCNMCASAVGSANGNPYSYGTWTQAKHNEHTLDSEINRLKQCPNCMSMNYSEKEVRYEK